MPRYEIQAGPHTFELDDPDGSFMALPAERRKSIVDQYVAGQGQQQPRGRTLTIGDQKVTVDDSFLKLSPEQQNATVEEIASKLNGQAAPKGFLDHAGDFLKSMPRGALGGLSQALSAGGQAAQIEMGQPVDVPSANDTRGILEKNVTGDLPQPQGRAGKYGESVGEFLGNPASYVGPGGIPAKVGTAILGGLGSQAGTQATEGTKAEPYGGIVGALLGGIAPSVAGRAVTPIPASASRQRLVNALNDEGVTSLTAGQRTGSEALRYAESALGNSPGAGGKTNAITRAGQEEFTDAALRRAGTRGEAAPENLAANNTRLGNEFEALSARNTLQMDPQFLGDVHAAVGTYQRVPPSQQRAIVEGYVNDIMQHAQQGGQMPGTFYQEMRSRLSRQSNSLRNTDPTLSGTLADLRDALDNGMRRSIPDADRVAWDAARQQWGAQKVIEKSASRAGEATAEGQIVPANLRNTVSAENRGAYARGEGQFSELARAGAGVMGGMPQSGTGPRAALHAAASLLGGAAGSVGGLGVGSGAGAVAGAIAGPAIAGRALMSPLVQMYLGNQRATPFLNSMTPKRAAMINALIAGEQQGRRDEAR